MFRNIMRTSYRVLAWIFVIALTVQIYLAGLGVFRFRSVPLGEGGGRSFYGLHIQFGWLIGWVPILLIVLALLGRYSRRTITRAVGLVLLIIIQSVILWVAQDAPLLKALHPVNAIFIFWLSLSLAREALKAEGGAQGLPTDTEKQPT